MALAEFDSAVGATFGIEVDGQMVKQISEISGLKLEQTVVELKENTADGKYINRFLPGRPKPCKITLTRAMTESSTFQDWIKDSRLGDMSKVRKGASIIVFDYQGTEIRRYNLRDVWPESLEIGSMKSGAGETLTEKLVINCAEVEVA
jgi:phage tail-like protein